MHEKSINNEARFNLPDFLAVRFDTYPLEVFFLRWTSTQRDSHLDDHGGAVVLAGLCALPFMASPTHGWLQTSAALSARLRSHTQHTCVPDRDSCDWQNFTTV